MWRPGGADMAEVTLRGVRAVAYQPVFHPAQVACDGLGLIRAVRAHQVLDQMVLEVTIRQFPPCRSRLRSALDQWCGVGKTSGGRVHQSRVQRRQLFVGPSAAQVVMDDVVQADAPTIAGSVGEQREAGQFRTQGARLMLGQAAGGLPQLADQGHGYRFVLDEYRQLGEPLGAARRQQGGRCLHGGPHRPAPASRIVYVHGVVRIVDSLGSVRTEPLQELLAGAAGVLPGVDLCDELPVDQAQQQRPPSCGVQQPAGDARGQPVEVPVQHGPGLFQGQLVHPDFFGAGRQQFRHAGGDQTHTGIPTLKEGVELLGPPDVIEHQKRRLALVQQAAQMGAGQGRIFELGGVAGDEPRGLSDLGGDAGAPPHIPADGDGVYPVREDLTHPRAGADHLGQRRLAEPSRTPQRGCDPHRAPVVQHRGLGLFPFLPVDDPVSLGRRGGRWRVVLGAVGRGLLAEGLHHHAEHRKHHARPQHGPGISAQQVQRARPVILGCPGVAHQPDHQVHDSGEAGKPHRPHDASSHPHPLRSRRQHREDRTKHRCCLGSWSSHWAGRQYTPIPPGALPQDGAPPGRPAQDASARPSQPLPQGPLYTPCRPCSPCWHVPNLPEQLPTRAPAALPDNTR